MVDRPHFTVPRVASYCTTFLKPEMLHIYRQVTPVGDICHLQGKA